MTRLHATFAILVGASIIATSGVAALAQTAQPPQTPQPPPMTSILAGKKLTPPIKGEANVEFMQPVTKREKGEVVTKITVKNISNAPIPRLTIAETWFDKKQQMVTGGKGYINGLLQPGEVKTIEIRTPYDQRMTSNSWNFSHANGNVKTHKVAKLDDPNAKKEPAAKAAADTKAAAKKPAAKKPAAKKKK
jgi:hypothetical protein